MDLSKYSNSGFDRGASLPKEALWMLIRFCFFQSHLPLPSKFRTFLLSLFGAKVGKGLVIRAGLNITFPWRLSVGDHVWIGEGVTILNLAPVAIESSVCISQKAFLCTGSHDYRSPGFALRADPILIRSGSWIAAQAFVGPGVEIGAGAVVSAGSVVMENVPARTLVRGNPAAVVKQLPPEG